MTDHHPFIYNDLEGSSITFHGGAQDDDGQDTVAVEADQIGRGPVWVHVRHTDAARVADELRAAAGLPPVSTDQAGLRDRIAVVLAEKDGWECAHGLGLRDMSESTQKHYDALADAVLAVLPAPADRAATASTREKRARLFGFIEVGADESDLPSFAAALDDYINAVTAPIAETTVTPPDSVPGPATRRERYAVAIHDAMEPDLSLVDQEPAFQALMARAAEAAEALADAELAGLRRKLADAERIRANADFHLGQEMARRQAAEKETARLSADRATVLNATAQHLYTALFPAVYDDMGQKAAEGVQRAVSELRRMAAEAQQPTDEDVVEAHRLALSFALGLGTSAPWDAIRERAAELAAQQPDCTCDPAPHREQDGTYSHGAGCPVADAEQQAAEAELPASGEAFSRLAAADCPHGVGRASGSGCIKSAGHDGPHIVTPGVPEQDDRWRAYQPQVAETDLTARLGNGRTQLLEAMSAVSEDRTCTGWAADWARTLHAEGGIWETIGRAVGWPTGNYDQWVWRSWDEAGVLYATEEATP